MNVKMRLLVSSALIAAVGIAATASNSQAQPWDCYCTGGEIHGDNVDFIGSAKSRSEGNALCSTHRQRRGEHGGSCSCKQRV